MDDRSQHDSNAGDGERVARWCNFGCRTNRSGEKTFCKKSCRLPGLLNYDMNTHIYAKTTHIKITNYSDYIT